MSRKSSHERSAQTTADGKGAGKGVGLITEASPQFDTGLTRGLFDTSAGFSQFVPIERRHIDIAREPHFDVAFGQFRLPLDQNIVLALASCGPEESTSTTELSVGDTGSSRLLDLPCRSQGVDGLHRDGHRPAHIRQ
jgi:hypothetical protein